MSAHLVAHSPYPLALQSIVALVLIATPLNALFTYSRSDPQQLWLLCGIMLLHLLLCLTMPIRRLRAWQQLAVMLGQCGLVVLAYTALPVPLLTYVLLAIVLQAVYLFRPWLWIPFACLVWLGWSGTLIVVSANLLEWVQRNLTLAFPATCILIAAVLYARQHHRRTQVQQLTDQMQQHYDMLRLHLREAQQRAVVEERHRLIQTVSSDISTALANAEQAVVAAINQAQTNIIRFQFSMTQTRQAASVAIDHLRGAVTTLRGSGGRTEGVAATAGGAAPIGVQSVDGILTTRGRKILTWILPVVFVALALPQVLLQQPPAPAFIGRLLLFCGMLVVAYILTQYLRHPLMVQVGLASQFTIILILVIVTQTMPLLPGVLLVMWQIALRLSLFQILTSLFGVHMSIGLLLTRIGPLTADYGSHLLAAGVACAAVVGLVGMARRQVCRRQADEARLARLAALTGELEQQEAEVRTLAVAAERTRLARELHDDLGYRLVLLNVQLQLAEDLIAEDLDAALQQLVTTREQLAAAWSSAVATVENELLLDATSLVPALHALIQPYRACSVPHITLKISGSPARLPVALVGTIYRTVQEGLTNAYKYAEADRIDIRINVAPDQVQVSVQDDGRGAVCSAHQMWHNGNRAGRFGLAGLRERAALLGGSVQAGSLPAGGFGLELTLPLGES
jgi:signal transduction histidine kinase